MNKQPKTFMELHLLTASQLVNLLQILSALVVDYATNSRKPMIPELKKIVDTPLRWKSLPSLGTAIQTAIKGGSKAEILMNLGLEVKHSFADFRATREYTSAELELLKALATYLISDSEPALAKIKRQASILENPTLAKFLTPPIPKADNDSLRRSVKTLVGRDGTHLTRDESDLLKETDPEAHAKYLELRKAHNKEAKATLMDYVRSQNTTLVDYEKARSYLVSQGFDHILVPGFNGKMDDQGHLFTNSGDSITGSPNLATYEKIVMNDGKDPEAKWIFKAIKPSGEESYFYTDKFRKSQSSAKFEHVKDLMTNIGNIRSNWLSKIKKFDMHDKDAVCAVVLEILYSFAARVGTAPGRGVGTLLAKNAIVNAQGVTLRYLGKDSIKTTHKILSTDPVGNQLVKALELLLTDKSGRDYIFTYIHNNKELRCTPADINKAFHDFGAPSSVTVHKLRTCRGTALFKQLVEDEMSKARKPANEKQGIAIYKRLTEQVGKLLNHKRGVGSGNEKITGTTAATSYIDPQAQLMLFDFWGFRPPKQLEKLLESED